MNQTQYDQIKLAAYNDELKKIAKANPGSIERELGTIFSDKQEDDAKKHIKAHPGSKNFVARHPFLTGIPSLGLVPYINSKVVEEDVMRKLIKENPDLKDRYHKMNESAASKPDSEPVHFVYSLNSK